MGNLALHSAEEPDNLRATTGTVEVPTKRDNDVALAPGARPSQQHEPAARHKTITGKYHACVVPTRVIGRTHITKGNDLSHTPCPYNYL